LRKNRIYSVLVVITDGNCHDMEMTKTVIVENSTLPFSAVILGVGDGDFEDMAVLDADAEILKDN